MQGYYLTPGLAALECLLVCISLVTGGAAFFLIRSARRHIDIKHKRPAYLPSTPLTRERSRRVREVAHV